MKQRCAWDSGVRPLSQFCLGQGSDPTVPSTRYRNMITVLH